ncbi:hypothetical protein K1719_008510 [Acacia pycnantha]|nr:hypothetical protein K1719_008510 [Acacia pycnantha]
MEKRYCYKDLIPFAALVTMECNNVGLNTLFKAATLKGMSYHVFVVYAYGVAAIVLLPLSFFSRRSRELPPLNFSIFSRILLLGFIGCSSQIMGYTGISYSSPTLSSAISNLVPAFTFLLAIIFRMETIALKCTSCQAKILGTIVSISGAFVVTLYQGPPIIIAHAPSFSHHQPLNFLKSVDRSWAIGGLLLTAEYILVPLWYIVQVQIMRAYPDELTVVFFYNLCGIFGSFLNNAIHTWALHIKGPLYVAMFKPLSIAIAVAMGVIFLGDALYLGSLIGATIISIGFYTVMWGKSTEEVDKNDGRVESPNAENVPLLQGYDTERAVKKMHANA